MNQTPVLTPVFPLSDVDVRQVKDVRMVTNPTVDQDWISLNEDEFWMQVANVGEFYARDGCVIEFAPAPGTRTEAVELFLNGSVYGAILHQRGILPIHGSCFVYRKKGVMLCGDSGAGKSSLTASMCLSGKAEFLTDDVTPIVGKEDNLVVLAKSGRMKLWEDSLSQLSQTKANLKRIRPEDNKFYVNIDSSKHLSFPLHEILILSKSECKEPDVEIMSGTEAFSVLWNEIYRLYYLKGMPSKQAGYFQQLSDICNRCLVRKVHRPSSISIEEMKNYLIEWI